MFHGGKKLTAWVLLCCLVPGIWSGLPEPGKWVLNFNSSHEYNGVAKNVYGNTKVYIKIRCTSLNPQNVKIGWLLRETQVWQQNIM